MKNNKEWEKIKTELLNILLDYEKEQIFLKKLKHFLNRKIKRITSMLNEYKDTSKLTKHGYQSLGILQGKNAAYEFILIKIEELEKKQYLKRK